MLPFVEDNVPQLLLQPSRMAFCGNLHLKMPRQGIRCDNTLVLSKDLKFYEFRLQDLEHFIDLRGTRLQKFAAQLKEYSGPVSQFLRHPEATGDDALEPKMLQSPEDVPLALGKYIWQQQKVYIFVHCWQHLLVLHRPQERGANFELVAEHEAVEAFQMVNGPVPYQAIVELRFASGKRLRTDFQEALADEEAPQPQPQAQGGPSDPSGLEGFKELVQQVNQLQGELLAARQQTQRDVAQLREQQMFGSPGQRSLLLEEKQLVRRMGDVWTRVCGDHFVCGVLLINLGGAHRLTLARELLPLIYLEPARALQAEQRLFELPLQADGRPPEDYDRLAQFWACQEQLSRRLKWRPVPQEGQLAPERSAVMVVRLPLADLLEVEEMHLMAIYEVWNGPEDKDKETRQLPLVTLNLKKMLRRWETLAPTFEPRTLHQDFLAVVMCQQGQCVLRLIFQRPGDCREFEEQLVAQLGFQLVKTQEQQEEEKEQDKHDGEPRSRGISAAIYVCIFRLDSDPLDASFTADSQSTADRTPVQHIFYNRQSNHPWGGVLILRDDPGKHWHVYAATKARLQLLLHTLKRNLLRLECNVTEMEVKDYITEPDDVAKELDASLYAEVDAWKELLEEQSREGERDPKRHFEKVTRLHRQQMASDVLYTMLRKLNAQDKSEADGDPKP
ncbi:hypothetical protein KR018_011537 [Drosophila ironensis]|nr:hypothetical protein KR018_011537 [Drosophila ironensis]